MSSQEINFQDLKESIITFLEGETSIVLATASNNRVTARSISFVNRELEFFFVTWIHHTKSIQIHANENVALCIGRLQVEGKANIRGALSDPKKKEYLDLYKKKHPRHYDKFARQPETTLITIQTSLFVKLVIIEGDYYRDHLILANNSAYRLRIKD